MKGRFTLTGAIGLLLVSLLGGCSATQIQLWANSDSDDSSLYTQRTPHYVHVGETVQFRVPVQPDNASYVVINLEGQEILAQKVNKGDYAFTWTFDEKRRDRRVYLEARAYRQVEHMDYLNESGRLRKLQAGNDPPDVLLGVVRMQVVCYQSQLVIQLSTPGRVEPNWSRAVLDIYGPKDKVSKVGLGQPGADGFVALGINSAGMFTVMYEPKIGEIRKTGKTKAVLTFPNPSGEGELTKEVWFDTP